MHWISVKHLDNETTIYSRFKHIIKCSDVITKDQRIEINRWCNDNLGPYYSAWFNHCDAPIWAFHDYNKMLDFVAQWEQNSIQLAA